MCSELIADLKNSIVPENMMPSKWNDEGKDEILDRGNFGGLKLTKDVLKVVGRIIEVIIRDVLNVDVMQFRFIPQCGTIDVSLA